MGQDLERRPDPDRSGTSGASDTSDSAAVDAADTPVSVGDPGAASATTTVNANHGSAVSDSAQSADPVGGKGEEVAPAARDNHGAEVRTTNPSSPPTDGGPANRAAHTNEHRAELPPDRATTKP